MYPLERYIGHTKQSIHSHYRPEANVVRRYAMASHSTLLLQKHRLDLLDILRLSEVGMRVAKMVGFHEETIQRDGVTVVQTRRRPFRLQSPLPITPQFVHWWVSRLKKPTRFFDLRLTALFVHLLRSRIAALDNGQSPPVFNIAGTLWSTAVWCGFYTCFPDRFLLRRCTCTVHRQT